MTKPRCVSRELIEALKKDPIYGQGAEEKIRQGKWIIDDAMEAPQCQAVRT
ncbi:hypothetical protein [Methanocalculus sp.]|uniref:hypothetical protein n=1 Tax=Methanocalculus sp. TaxID=2004547 RepID=UPI00260624E1|nr:hypothetical protein [Methanocalculus sp.]MDG6250475.1 hypothetical protein [Methanocalculus sp.]